ncbi:DEAD/DEAH box helicase family protein [Oceanospirillum sp. D5]|uniref:DEAD/DEAH box helicase family protein n=2 Tax=Oceanospirillum sediminis TaxID=2760088 RepID=A0A839IW06_9GAMM|nr:DEAD/DEAH box helicase family protein [Oceanospirillum sediminis]
MSRIEFMISQNFEYLRPHWPDLASLCAYAEQYVHSDPQSALVKLRCYAEKLTGEVYRLFQLPTLANDKFLDRLNNQYFCDIASSGVLDKLHAIRRAGNRAAHEGRFNKGDSPWLLQEAHHLGCWLLLTTGKGDTSDISPFILPEVVKKTADSTQTRQLEKALKELEEAKAAEQKALAENARLKHQVDTSVARQASEKARSRIDLNEAQTRRRLIDTELYARGWDIDLVDGKNTDQVTLEEPVEGQPTPTGVGYCDYVLWGDDGKPLAVIEAKRALENINTGREQAVLYADALEKKYGQRPVIFYTNGHDIRILDDAQGYRPRRLYSFYSKESLEYLIRQRRTRKALCRTPVDHTIAGRTYQIESITRVCERFEKFYRKALVVQATGTGKTRVSIALSKRMIEAGWTKRILFLCDRKELRKQAAAAYNSFMSEPLYVVGKSKAADRTNARLFIATYPGMMKIMEEFDPGYFDLIIADESHRSIYNVYGDLFKYFDALQLGLTATPVEMISRSTSDMFGCDYKMPTANYPLEQAIEDRNLVPFKVVSHTTQFLREGINEKSLSDEQMAQLEEQGIDPNELDFSSAEIDKAVFNKDTNRHILRNLMEKGLRLGDGQTLGKSIIFARNIQHAELLADLFDEMYPEQGVNFCRVIHSRYERAEELIDNFKLTDNSDAQITIAVSVDMLDTGIDVPEILNLVMARPIRSKVKFWQMIGRGTRLCDNLYGPDQHKEKFLIFDHWDNFEYFEQDPDEDDGRQSKSVGQKLFEGRVRLAEEALKQGKLDVFEQVLLLIKDDIDQLNDKSIAVKDQWQYKHALSQMEVLKQFTPQTRQQLLEIIAPLMQWRDIRGQGEAMKWDLELVNAQFAHLTQAPELEQCRLQITTRVRQLSMHLNEVRAKADAIQQVQDDYYWNGLSVARLENTRQALRPVIHLRDTGAKVPPMPVNIIDVIEDNQAVYKEERKTNIRTVDYEIYRQEVEKTLTPLFETTPVLQKIRSGEAISEQELDTLNALVHESKSRIDLKLLKEFFPDSAVGVDQLLRTIVGLDARAVEDKFTAFVQTHHIHLNSLQQRFLDLLKREICRRGEITVADLYDHPFQSLHDDGIDGLFRDEQASLIAGFVAQFTVPAGQGRNNVEVTEPA